MRMDANKLIVLYIAIILTGLTSGCSEPQQPTPASTGLMKGQQAPDFTLQDLNGNEVTLSSYQNKSNVCLVFWATWCPYCVKEIPMLKSLHEKYASKGIQVVSVNVGSNDPIKRVRAFHNKYALNYTVLYDSSGIASRLYGVTGIPVSIIIDKKGIIRFRSNTLPENIDQLFAEMP